MLKHIAIVTAMLIPTTAVAQDLGELSDYKTTVVQPVVGASNSPGLFEAQMAAAGAMLSPSAEQKAAAKKALPTGDSGFGFAGKAKMKDVLLLAIGTRLGMVPTLLEVAPERVQVPELEKMVNLTKGKVAPPVTRALENAVAAVKREDRAGVLRSLLIAARDSTLAISKGNQRAHGYMASGLLTGVAFVWGAAGVSNPDLGNLTRPLIALLNEDAVMGGADREVARHLGVVAAELRKPSPRVGPMRDAANGMASINPDK